MRWVIVLPGAVIAYFILYYIAFLGWYWYAGDVFTKGFVGLTLQAAMFTFIPLYFVHECVSKFKFHISMVTSGLYVIFGIGTFILFIYTRPVDMVSDYFFSTILQSIVITVCTVLMIIGVVAHWVEHSETRIL